MKTINVVAAVIVRQGKVLCTQRGYGEWKGWWEFPGGKVESGESPSEALQREIKEELASEIIVWNKLCTVEYDYPQFHLSMQCYICTLVSETPVLLEHQASCWLQKENLDTVEWLPADKLIVHMLKNYQTEGWG